MLPRRGARLRQGSLQPARPIATTSSVLFLNRHRACRYASSVAQPSPRISTVFGVLLTVGLATTAFGLYEFYSSFTLWPKEVRSDLRAGIKAKHQGNLDLSERFFQRAWETTRTLSPSQFGSAPNLKITGVLIILAEVLEANNKPQLAYELMADYLDQLPPRNSSNTDTNVVIDKWSGPERMRLVAIAYRLGEMADMYSQPATEEEKWLSWSVTELLATLHEANEIKDGRLDIAPALHELELPNWVSKIDVAAPLQSLGEYYSRTGKLEYALRLYFEALKTLTGESIEQALPQDRCRAGELMTNLSELLTRPSSSPEDGEERSKRLLQAESLALQAVKFVTNTTVEELEPIPACTVGFSVILANLGTITMMKGQPDAARRMFEVSLRHAIKRGYQDQVIQVRRLLKEAERAEQTIDGGIQ